MTHAFENSGLGKAPFKVVDFFVGPSKSLLEQNPTAFYGALAVLPKVNIGGCAHCATAIKRHYVIESADGKRFAVGADCVRKTGDKGLTDDVEKIERKARQAKAAETRAAKVAAEKERRAAGAVRFREMTQARKDLLAPIAAIVDKSPHLWTRRLAERLADGVAIYNQEDFELIAKAYAEFRGDYNEPLTDILARARWMR